MKLLLLLLFLLLLLLQIELIMLMSMSCIHLLLNEIHVFMAGKLKQCLLCSIGRMKWNAVNALFKEKNIHIYIIYIYVPGTQMTLVLIGKGLVLGGWPSKIEVIGVPGIYLQRFTSTTTVLYNSSLTLDSKGDWYWDVANFKNKLGDLKHVPEVVKV